MSNLIPVIQRGESTARNAPVGQMVMKRLAAPTGGALGALFGGSEGYQRGGIGGVIHGAIVGGLLPQLVATPEGWMLASRMMNRAPQITRGLVGSGLQYNRPDLFPNSPDSLPTIFPQPTTKPHNEGK